MRSDLRRRLLVDFQGRRVPYPTGRTTIHLFEDHARDHPDRPALRWADACLTYGELDALAARWAGVLRARGVERGDFVPLVTAGGPELPVMMLASMKVGAPFVPIDDAWPRQRLHESLRRLRPRVVVRTGPGPEAGDTSIGLDGLDVVRVAGTAPPDGAAAVPEAVATVDDLAYGFFTSGSTGAPKCALNRHLGLLNRFLSMTRRFGAQRDVVLQNSRHVFDSSLWQLLWPLTKGSQVVLPDRAGILDLPRTVEEMARYGVTATDFVPSVFNILVELLTSDPGLRGRLTSLRHLLIGGEEIDPGAVRAFRAMFPRVTLTNTFGPTEASIGSVFHEIQDQDGSAVPIGRPIDNTCAILLDERGRLVEPGTIGEIYLGGDCLGTGYLGDARRTAAAFVPNPFAEIPGTRLYRTGDLAWQRDDGALMFVGRRDQQIKLNGALIDLLEVETAVAGHPAVHQAKTVVHGHGDLKTLACCYVAEAPVSARELAAHCGDLLPAHAVPRVFLPVARVPLTGNGKTDRMALKREVAARLSTKRQETAAGRGPRLTERQHELARLWAQLLPSLPAGLPRPDSGFHELGGTSLTLQRLAGLIQRSTGLRLPLKSLAAAGTLAEQAALLMPGGTGAARALDSAADQQMRADIERAAAVPPAPGHPPSHAPRHALLTGATGFLGVHLLAELLERTEAVVHCLVRARDQGEARLRLDRVLAEHGLDLDAGRIVPVPGDLARPRLGLAAEAWEGLAERTDSIVHAGALVNLVLGYSGLRAPNVLGTAEVLRLAVTGRPKRLHHVSTLGVIPEGAGPLLEEHRPLQAPRGGYGRSKWAAEQILAAARGRGIPSTVFRLGEVMAHSRTGRGNPRSVLELLLRACVRLRLRVATDAVTDWTPVDQAASALVEAVRTGRDNDSFHVLRPGAVRIDRLLALLHERLPLRETDYRTFHAQTTEGAAHGAAELAALRSLLPDPETVGPGVDALAGLFGDGGRQVSCKHGSELAEACGLAWTPVGEDVLLACVRRLVSD